MRVRLGWSGETESNTWHKVDIELEEEDLTRLLRENQLPEELSARLPTKVCFQLMQNDAEVLLLAKLRNLGYPHDKANARIATLIDGSNEIIAAVKRAA